MYYYFVAVVASDPSNVLDSNTSCESLRVTELDVKWSVIATVKELLPCAEAALALVGVSLKQ
jgi:hypothetical protein